MALNANHTVRTPRFLPYTRDCVCSNTKQKKPLNFTGVHWHTFTSCLCVCSSASSELQAVGWVQIFSLFHRRIFSACLPMLDPRLKVPPQPGLSYSFVAKSRNKRAGGTFWCLQIWHMSHVLTCCWCDQVMWPRAKLTGQERERWFWTAVQSSRMLTRHFSLHLSNTELLIFPSKPASPAFLPFQLLASPVAWTKILGIIPDSSFSCSISNVLENPVNLAIKLCFSIQSLHTTQCCCLVRHRVLLSSLQ